MVEFRFLVYPSCRLMHLLKFYSFWGFLIKVSAILGIYFVLLFICLLLLQGPNFPQLLQSYRTKFLRLLQGLDFCDRTDYFCCYRIGFFEVGLILEEEARIILRSIFWQVCYWQSLSLCVKSKSTCSSTCSWWNPRLKFQDCQTC